jgi:hypothetical protein
MRIKSPSTTTPHLGLLHSPSSIPEVAHLSLATYPPTHPHKHTYTHTHTHTHTNTVFHLLLLFLIPSYVDVSRGFCSCAHQQSHFIWSHQPLPLLSPFPFSPLIPPFFNSSQTHILLTLACPGVTVSGICWGSIILFSFSSFPESHGAVVLLETCSA